ncbi:hypothetical protein [Aneurinibacillus tyrosinisolvens]|uniref:hypothetical protein n=1 Tax=Aneurinibacillus tyrosinisolvens TaxID=1443435 RepID=UPI00063F3A56|nr:hypothetical protein [Aneurinibacillus tyrosinisolvens]
MTRIDEIAPDIFRISIFVPQAGMQFNQFLIRDDEPLLFTTGLPVLWGLRLIPSLVMVRRLLKN